MYLYTYIYIIICSYIYVFLPARASEQGNVIGSVRIYIYTVADLGGDPGVHGNPPFLPE